MDDVFGPISAAGHHEKGRSHEWPESELCSTPGWGNCPGGELGWEGYRAQFIVASSLSTILALSAENSARVRRTQNTDICSRCKNYLHSNERISLHARLCGCHCGEELLWVRVAFRFAPLTSLLGPYCPLFSRQNAPDILARVHFYLRSDVMAEKNYCGFAWPFASRL